MIREIVTDREKLCVRSNEVDITKQGQLVRAIVLDLKDTIRENNLKSLSAVQIGTPERVVVLNFSGDLRSFVNPVVNKVEGLTIAKETCPSLPGKSFIVPRYTAINIMYQTPLGKIENKRLVGASAVVFQHELDHLEGLLVDEMGFEVDDDFDNASDEEKQEIISAYLDAIDIRIKDLQAEIDADEETKKIQEVLNLQRAVSTGKVETEKFTRPYTPEELAKIKQASNKENE